MRLSRTLLLLGLVAPAARAAAQPSDFAAALRTADSTLTGVEVREGRLDLLYDGGVRMGVPLDGVVLTADPGRRRLSLDCRETLCIRGERQASSDGVVWSFGEAGAASDPFRTALEGLRAMLPAGAIRVDSTAAPAADLIALVALPAERWTSVQRPDTILVDMTAAEGATPGAWLRIRYTRPRLHNGQPFDTHYAHFAVQCTPPRVRLTRMAFSHDYVVVGDTALEMPEAAAAAGTRSSRLVDLVCNAPADTTAVDALARLADALARGPEGLLPLRGAARRSRGHDLVFATPDLGRCGVFEDRIGCVMAVSDGSAASALDGMRARLRSLPPGWTESPRSTQGWLYRHPSNGVTFTLCEEAAPRGGRQVVLYGWLPRAD